jgi:hypothetical protein
VHAPSTTRTSARSTPSTGPASTSSTPCTPDRIQGTARELLVDTLVRWRDTRWSACTLLPVHDELDVFVPESEAVEATAELVRCMETELLGVKIVAEPSTPSFAWQDSS